MVQAAAITIFSKPAVLSGSFPRTAVLFILEEKFSVAMSLPAANGCTAIMAAMGMVTPAGRKPHRAIACQQQANPANCNTFPVTTSSLTTAPVAMAQAPAVMPTP